MSKSNKDKKMTDSEIQALYDRVEEALSDMQSNYGAYCPDPEKTWQDHFSWSEAPFHNSADDIVACGDPGFPYPDAYKGELYWRESTSAYTVGQYIPPSLFPPSEGKTHGIQRVTFWEYDGEGDRECDAEFIRKQPGYRWTEADENLLKDAEVEMDKAREEHQKTGSFDAWRKADSVLKCLENAKYYADCEDYWDPEEFQYHVATSSCHYTLLGYARYGLWCALHGEDPLGRVYPESVTRRGKYLVTARADGKGGLNVTAKHLEGDDSASLLADAIGVMGDYSLDEIKRYLKEQPEGDPISDVVLNSSLGWKPAGVTIASASVEVEVAKRSHLENNPERIREVYLRREPADTEDLLRSIEKLKTQKS